MVQGIIEATQREMTRGVSPEKAGRPEIFPGQLYVYPAVLSQVIRGLDADAAALIRYYPAGKELHFEFSDGAWKDYSGKRLTVKEDVTGLVIHPGQISRKLDLHGKERFPFIDLPQELKAIAFMPIASSTTSIQAMWVARRSGFNDIEINRIQDASEALSNVFHLVGQNGRLASRLEEIVVSLTGVMAVCDMPTYRHSLRLVPWAEATARLLGMKDKEIGKIRWATLLHDLGKIAIPKSILYKPGPYTPEEWAVMKRHPDIGAKIIASIKGLAPIAEIVRSHHEKFDGTGYPTGAREEEISLSARIVAVVDAYGAMTENRVYRKTTGHLNAIAEIKRCAGTDFDPRVCDAFLRLF